MELNENQLKAVRAPEKRILIDACPACGKTRVLIERVNYLLGAGVEPKSIVLLTFTNSAAAELRERINNCPRDLFIGTVHGYANYLLCTHGYDTIRIIQLQEFDRLFDKVKEFNTINKVSHLLLDEAQDISETQFDFVLNCIKPENYFIVGDHRQTIYQWAGVTSETMTALLHDEDVKVYRLNQNYRNGINILSFARSIINSLGTDYIDNSITMHKADGIVRSMEYSGNMMCNEIKNNGNYNDWFILCRTNAQLETFSRDLEEHEIPFSVFYRATMDNADLREEYKKNTVKLMTIHASKGLESKNVMVIGAKMYNTEERCISYVAATRAKDRLIWIKNKKRQ